MQRKASGQEPADFSLELSQQRIDRRDSNNPDDLLEYSEDESVNEGILAELRAEQQKAEEKRRMELLAESQHSKASSNNEDKRRERKAIFGKYKRQEEPQPQEYKKDLLIAFDEIFKKKETRVGDFNKTPAKAKPEPPSPAKTDETGGDSLVVVQPNDQYKLLDSLKGKDSIVDDEFRLMLKESNSPIKPSESIISGSHLSKIYPIERNTSNISYRQSSDLFEELLKENIFNDLSKIEGDTNKSSLLSGSIQFNREDLRGQGADLETIQQLDQPKQVKIPTEEGNGFRMETMDISEMEITGEVGDKGDSEVSVHGLLHPPNLSMTRDPQTPSPAKEVIVEPAKFTTPHPIVAPAASPTVPLLSPVPVSMLHALTQVSPAVAPTTQPSIAPPKKQADVISVAPLVPFKEPQEQLPLRPASPPVPAALIEAMMPKSPIKLMTGMLRDKNYLDRNPGDAGYLARPSSQASFEATPSSMTKQNSLGTFDITAKTPVSPVSPLELAKPQTSSTPFAMTAVKGSFDLEYQEAEQQQSICPLLREAHRLNSTSANTSLPKVNLVCYKFREQTLRLANELLNANSSLIHINDEILKRELKQKELYRNFKPESFTQGTWMLPVLNIQAIKPGEPYERHNCDHIRIEELLRKMGDTIKEVKLTIDWKVNFTSVESRKLYPAIRATLDIIFTNLRTISQDLYNKAFVSYVPEHYFTMYAYLKDTIFPHQNADLRAAIGQKEAMLTLVRFMRESHDPLCSSSLGLDLVSKLEGEIRRLKATYYANKTKRIWV